MSQGIADRVTEYAIRLDEATPEGRDRYIDLLRAIAIGAVVLGHWLTTAIIVRGDGRLDGVTVLEVADWTHWLTWIFQVMPIFFLVGGYANATSWQRHSDAGGGWAAWVHRRSVRLLGPTAAFVAVAVGAVVIARLAGADPELVADAGWLAGVPLWFLAVYIAVAGLTPLSYGLHRRYGLRATALLAAAVAAGDIARVVTGEPAWATANFVLGWAVIHQIGFWWHDGALPTRGAVPSLAAAGGAVALVVLTMPGPWPVAMVDVPEAQIQNSSPPSLALLALACVQTGIALAVAERARRWLQRPLAWTVVAGGNRVILTLFLWHMSAAAIGAAALHGTGLLPAPQPLSAEWFAWRPVWVACLAVITAVLVAVFAPVEQRTGRALRSRAQAPRIAMGLAGLGVALACLGLAQLTLGGLAGEGPLGIPTLGGSAFAVGAAMTLAAGWFERQPERS